MDSKTIVQKEIFNCTAEQFYNTFLDADLHSSFTESICFISSMVGQKFSIYDGYILGENVELIPNKKIIQTWLAVEDDWPSEHFSTVTFLLEEISGKTILNF